MKKIVVGYGIYQKKIQLTSILIMLMFAFGPLACKKDSLPPDRLVGYQWRIFTKSPTDEMYWTSVEFKKDSSILETNSPLYWKGRWTLVGDTVRWNMTSQPFNGVSMTFEGVLNKEGTFIQGTFSGGLYGDGSGFNALRW